nr:fumarylacetoacetate hydrolase family protein [Bradyrhizobium jicamae]
MHHPVQERACLARGHECHRHRPFQPGRPSAWTHIAGYSIYNDVSVRDWQRHAQQIASGKNFVGTGPFGPWLVTPDDIGDPTNLKIETRVNGAVMQSAETSMLIFPVPRLIEYCSTIFELVPGDVIVTGTPAGVGFTRKPPIFLKPGTLLRWRSRKSACSETASSTSDTQPLLTLQTGEAGAGTWYLDEIFGLPRKGGSTFENEAKVCFDGDAGSLERRNLVGKHRQCFLVACVVASRHLGKTAISAFNKWLKAFCERKLKEPFSLSDPRRPPRARQGRWHRHPERCTSN